MSFSLWWQYCSAPRLELQMQAQQQEAHSTRLSKWTGLAGRGGPEREPEPEIQAPGHEKRVTGM